LSSKVPIAYIDVRTFAHATEDTDKVQMALLKTLSTEAGETVVLKESNLTGHHGNPIVLFEARIKEKDAVREVFRKLSSGLSMMDKELLGDEITWHLEKGNLYLRLDKQSAYLNELRLCETDPIHFKVHFKKSDTDQVVEICRQLGLIP
jgi:RNA binding exosome subunit